MRFLIQIPQLIYGGAEKVLVNFANTLVEHGHEVEVLEIYEKGLLKHQFDERVTFHAICSKEYTEKYYASLEDVLTETKIISKIKKSGKLGFSKVVGYRKFAEYLCAKHYKDKRYDVAINYLEIDSPKFLLESIKAKKYLQWIHTDVANMDNADELNKYLLFYEKMDAIICVAEVARNNFIKKYPNLEEMTHTLYNFYDKAYVVKLGNEYYQYKSQKPVMLSVGRMTAPKRYLRFLKVLRRIKDEGMDYSWHILGVGADELEIRKKIEEYGLQSNVYLEGVADNPYKYMKNCDLFVLPSGWEGFPTVTIEAKMLRCPVLATDVSGIREQMEHGKSGWIVDNTEESIYWGVKYLLENPSVMKRLKSNENMDLLWDSKETYKKFMEICE